MRGGTVHCAETAVKSWVSTVRKAFCGSVGQISMSEVECGLLEMRSKCTDGASSSMNRSSCSLLTFSVLVLLKDGMN